MKARLVVSLWIGAIASGSSFACLSTDDRDLDEVGGAAGIGGSAAGMAGAGASAGKGGSGGGGSGGATGGAGGSAGLASGGTGMVSGAGGAGGSNTAGTAGASGAGGASGGNDAGAGGAMNGGSGNTGGSNNAGSAGSNDGGTSGSNTAGAGGSNGCVPNYDCMLEAPASTGDAHQDCVNRINQFRAECACLPPLERWTEGEDCANEMAEYDSTRSAHAGFADGICDGGSAQNECPGWGSEEQVVDGCLQAMWSEGPPPQDPCDGDCFQEHGHFINMTNERYTAVACGFYETSDGEIWAVQNFTR